MFRKATVPNRLPDLSKMELTPEQIDAIQAILLQTGPVTEGSSVLSFRKPGLLGTPLRDASVRMQAQRQSEADAKSLRAAMKIRDYEGFREWYARHWKAATAIDARFYPERYPMAQQVRLGVFTPQGSK